MEKTSIKRGILVTICILLPLGLGFLIGMCTRGSIASIDKDDSESAKGEGESEI